MEMLLFFLLPVVSAIILLFLYKKEVTIVEAIGIVIPSFIIIGIAYAISYHSNTTSVEYLGDYAVKATHYDSWDEWVTKTCTRTVPCGRNSNGSTIYRTETYDCSHMEYHSDIWELTMASGEKHFVDESTFKKIVKKWNVKEVFLDMNRDFYTKDGDAQYYVWDNNIKTIADFTYENTYTNKIKASKSIFAFEDISKEIADSLNLFEYPKVVDYIQNPINGYKNATPADIQSLRAINGLYGQKYQVRVFLNVFYNKKIDISKKQQSYWVGGNKNELVINVGLDSISNKILWVDAFSWMDNPKLEIETEQLIYHQGKLNINELSNFLLQEIPKSWKRKEFKDFDYLSIELTKTQFYIIFFVLLTYIVISSIYFIKNDLKN